MAAEEPLSPLLDVDDPEMETGGIDEPIPTSPMMTVRHPATITPP
jgi:hypothetical protein